MLVRKVAPTVDALRVAEALRRSREEVVRAREEEPLSHSSQRTKTPAISPEGSGSSRRRLHGHETSSIDNRIEESHRVTTSLTQRASHSPALPCSAVLSVEAHREGAKTTVSMAAATRTQRCGPRRGAAHEAARGRHEVADRVGVDDARSQRGIVCGSTKTLLMNVSGNSTSSPIVCTALGVRSTRPRLVQTQDRLSAKTRTSATAASDPRRAAARVEAHRQAEPDDERGGEQVAADVAQQATDDRRRAPDGQRAEPVEDAGRQVGVQRDPRVDADQQHGHHQRARAAGTAGRRRSSRPARRRRGT